MLLTFVRGIALDPADDITGDCLGYFFPFHSYFIALAVLGKAGIACPSMKCSVTLVLTLQIQELLLTMESYCRHDRSFMNEMFR